MNPKDLVGAKKAPLRYVPPALMIAASGPMEDGAIKYGPFNWREYPVEVVTYVEAAIRHLLAFLDGQDRAEDSGHYHIDHAIAGLGIVVDSRELGTLIDNRFTAGPAADMLRVLDKSGKPADPEPKVYPAPNTGTLICIMCKTTAPDHALDCPLYMDGGFDIEEAMTGIMVEDWGMGDGPLTEFLGTPVEQPDGCYEYRGVHVHPTVATPATFRDIDRELKRRG